jgi:hypothetical protein
MVDEKNMKKNLRKIAKQVVDGRTGCIAPVIVDRVKDRCIQLKVPYSHELVVWAVDREVNKEFYSKVRFEQINGMGVS